MPTATTHHPASYRDPSGFIFEKDGVLYRQVHLVFKEHFDRFIQSGCYDSLTKKGLLVSHGVIQENLSGSSEHYVTLQPEKISFISYPYEWSFDMLKDAALLTLQLLKEALAFDMILKDATPYNIQWHKGKLVFIDTLSFEKYEETPWIAYRQFCECFLGLLLIMHYSKKQLPGLMLSWPEGIPLDIVAALIPKRSRFSLYTYLHIHLHARYAGKDNKKDSTTNKFSKQKLLNLAGSLESLISKLKTPAQKSTWSGYYEEAAQRNDYLEQKRKIVAEWVQEMAGIHTVADLGANEGEFSRILATKDIPVVAADFDPYCVNNLYRQIKNNKERYILPLVLDLSNPSPAIGVSNEERPSFIGRSGFDLVLALALIHHLAIGKNIPLDKIAAMFSRVGRQLIIEFVPKEDEKVQLMLQRKKDIYRQYDEVNFVKAFEHYFIREKKEMIGSGGRTLWLFKRRELE
ncbi:MAG: hypothetical protein JNK14_00640 [Chitinophagaceae bacterium]|nr:hypothetical protein [Chitinophagaceae bacterium]